MRRNSVYSELIAFPIIAISIILFSCSNKNQWKSVDNYPKNSLEYPERAVTQRASSYDTTDWENSNSDGCMIDPGEAKVIAELEGPGRITHIWLAANDAQRGFPRSVVIRIYWDGDDEPAVEAPLGDFFAAGHGMQVSVNSSMVATSSFGRAYNCYWKMPFRSSARITVTNDSENENLNLYWYIDWEKRAVPKDVPYFHAQYRQENPVQPGNDYLIADLEGMGHYIGTVLSVRSSQPGWFGEGDDRFYVDGDTVPTIHGTGSEDYINDAWAFRVVNRPYYGVSIWEGMNTGSRITAYRWHVNDPVFFEKSLKFTIEHKGNTFHEDYTLVDAFSDKRPDFYSSVAFWYQQGKAKHFSDMPPADERMAPCKIIQVDETMANALPHHVVIHESNDYTNRKGIQFIPDHINEAFTIPFDVPGSGNYLVFIRAWPRGDAGIYDFYFDDQLMLKGKDLWEEHHFVTDIKLGNMHRLKKGVHKIKAVYKGTSYPNTPGYLFVDAIVLEPVGDFIEKKAD
ncbi:MAG: DUF2961 domain-containing protein [Ignavibacteria bacterium]|jgi:hypothetical protein